MRKITLVCPIALLILLAACAKKQPLVPAPVILPPPPAPACDQMPKECADGTLVYRVPPSCQFASCPPLEEPHHREGLGREGDGADILQRDGDTSDILSELTCDTDTNTITLVINNPADSGVTYGLKRYSALNQPKDISPARLSLNGRMMRDLPSLCMDVALLEPGMSTKCSIDFTPDTLDGNIMVRIGPDEFGKPTENRMHFSSLDDQSELQFICD